MARWTSRLDDSPCSEILWVRCLPSSRARKLKDLDFRGLGKTPSPRAPSPRPQRRGGPIDPQGPRRVWQGAVSRKGRQVTEYEPGTPMWIDVASPNLDASKQFYSQLFGWEVNAVPGPAAGGYAFFEMGGKMIGGLGPTFSPEQPPAWTMYVRTPDVDATAQTVRASGGQFKVDGRSIAGGMDISNLPQEVPPHWLIYFRVDDGDEALEKLKGLGGSLVNGPFDIPMGRFTIARDPVGAVFGIIEFK
jgi:predicted enzyme related to lactoylglutathione lyase